MADQKMIITDRNKIYLSSAELKEAIVAYIRLKHGESQPIASYIENASFSFGWNPEDPTEYMISLKDISFLNKDKKNEQKSTPPKVSKKEKDRIKKEKNKKK